MALTKKLLALNVAITVTPLIDNNGVLSPAAAFTVTGRAGSASIARRHENERVEADDAEGADRQRTKKDWTLMLEAVKLITAAGDLGDLLDTYEYFQVAIRVPRGAGFRTETYTGLATENSWNKQIGRNVDALTIERVETGSPNPAIS